MPMAPWEVRREIMKSVHRATHQQTSRKRTWIEEHRDNALLARIVSITMGRRMR